MAEKVEDEMEERGEGSNSAVGRLNWSPRVGDNRDLDASLGICIMYKISAGSLFAYSAHPPYPCPDGTLRQGFLLTRQGASVSA